MSLDLPSVDIIAVAFVVESSLTVAAEWTRIFVDYVPHMLKRLTDAHPGYKLRLGIVTYGPVDTVPSPLLCNRLFIDYPPVLKVMRENPLQLGIGKTNSGGGNGMAALEGLVAAVELFDSLQLPPQAKDTLNTFHIFHVAACSPDSAQHPQFNNSPALDLTTWDTLPSELKQRKINLSSIHLRPQIPRLSELSTTAITTSITSPWFKLQPLHHIVLVGFSSPTQLLKTNKRLGENQSTDRPPDMKRPKLSPPQETSPKLSSTKTPPLPPTQLPSAPVLSQSQSLPPSMIRTPAAGSLTQVPPANRLPQQQQLLDHVRTVEEKLRQLEASIKHAEAMGEKEKAEQYTQEFKKRKEAHAKFLKAISTYAQTQQMNAMLLKQQVHGQPQVPSEVGNQSHSQPTPGVPLIARVQSSPIHSHQEVVPPTFGPQDTSSDNGVTAPSMAQSSVPTQSHNRSLSTGAPNLGQSPSLHPQSLSNMSPRTQMPVNVQAQMQKLLEQRNRASHANANMPVPTNQAQTHADVTSNAGMSQGSSANATQPNLLQGGEPMPPTKPTIVPVWQGFMSFNGTSNATKKEVRTAVIASTQPNSVAACRSDTWPTKFTLVPTRDPAVALPDLHIWIKRHNPVLCTFLPQPNVPDSKGNDQYYRMFVGLLAQRKIYATAAWTLPSGAQETNLLVFPANNNQLMGAFFPVSGIPEMPRPSKPSIPANLPMNLNLNPQFMAHMRSLPADKQAQFMMQMHQQGQFSNQGMMALAQKQQQLAHLQSKQDSNGSTVPPSYGNMSLPMQLLAPQNGPNGSNPMNLGTGLSNANLSRSSSGGMPGGVSYEMLQSFMQRNPDGGSGAGMGPT
ncbi:hypothetical protein BDQ12DRAFT_680349 [Crucibulum laeve]|uniref:Mediator of RNA polymerase II transcription subunit 25 von Willebrand factor type A domain-containing protein n=1 Tax=Crucibulum laeve TaxID=68775 RepID=A0A5C3M4C3_9AGAR|nr:hypothetical protein BDQ12DRAFT_680349 [Crucibulum laeve]